MRRAAVPAALAALGVLAGVSGNAAGQPAAAADGLAGWERRATEDGVEYHRGDGAVISVGGASLPCRDQMRPGAVDRPAWVSATYWPVADQVAGLLVLCLQKVEGPIAVVVKAPVGWVIGEDAAPALAELAERERPATVIPGLGPIHSSLPVVAADERGVTVAVDEREVAIGLVHDHGTCAVERRQRFAGVVPLADVTFPPGYAATVYGGPFAVGCLDVKDGHLAVTVLPTAAVDVVTDVLLEIRRAAFATHGAAPASDVGPIAAVAADPGTVGTRTPAPPVPRGRPAVAHGAVFATAAMFATAAGERRYGGLGGLDIRAANRDGFGYALAFDLEVGYGNGELVGEARTGLGLAVGRRLVAEALLGGGVGSLGPGAAVDLHAQLGVHAPMADHSVLWGGALYAVGIGGPDHLQLESRLHLSRRDGSLSWFFGTRYVAFADDAGTAALLSFGTGFASAK